MKIYIARGFNKLIDAKKSLSEAKGSIVEDFIKTYNKKNMPYEYNQYQKDNVIYIEFIWGKSNIFKTTYYINIYIC